MNSTIRTPAERELEPQIAKCRETFEAILRKATDPTSPHELDAMERELFADLMRLGAETLDLRTKALGDGHVGPTAKGTDGQARPFHSHKEVTYRSVFGEITIRRAYYWSEGQEGFCPLDARLNLPARKDSYLLQEWALRLGLVESYDETREGLAQLLLPDLPKRQLEQHVREVGQKVRDFYEGASAPKPKASQEGPILVVQADGKGVPMKKDAPAETPKRLSKGQKRQRKRMALVGTLYTMEPHRDRKKPAVLHHKEVFAELEKRDQFGQELFQRAKRRERGTKRQAFLADGQESLWEMKQELFPDFVGILDWLHATEYLWKTAYLFLPESSPQAHAWVERQKARFLRGQVKQVIREIQRMVRNETIRGAAKQHQAQNIVGYFQRNRERMRYDRYLRWGLPIGSGAVEGACKNLVKDRMEGSGMRWTVTGAQAMLNLRGVYLSRHWERFFRFYKEAERHRQYGDGSLAEAQRPAQKAA